jgi:tight adherence protein C
MYAPVVLLVIVFLSVTGLALGLGFWFTRDRALGRRIDRIQTDADTPAQTVRPNQVWTAKMAKLAQPFAHLSTPKDVEDASYLRVRFMNAGLRDASWLPLFFGIKVILTLLFPLVFLLYSGFIRGQGVSISVATATIVLASMGYYLPNALLAMKIRTRKEEVERALPDAIDMMTVCVEAGLALDGAIRRSCEELHMSSPALADELGLMLLELQAGSSRVNAMRNLVLRTGVADVATFVTIMLQSEHFGTDVGSALRTLSTMMRETRKQRAEEEAAKIPVKMLFPLIFFIFPSLFIVILGPAIIGIFRVLLPTLGGGN